MELPKWQYITYEFSEISIVEQVDKFSALGCPWIQLRMKKSSKKEILSTALEVKKICAKYKNIFTVNDYLDIMLEADADGLHLGKNDMNPGDAKKFLQNKILGLTANTLSDIKNAHVFNPNYIGLGPYAYTNTKENLSPIIGISGYKNICSSLNMNGFSTPVFAVGGIHEKDVEAILNTGIYGIAISSSLANHNNPKEFIKALNSL